MRNSSGKTLASFIVSLVSKFQNFLSISQYDLKMRDLIKRYKKKYYQRTKKKFDKINSQVMNSKHDRKGFCHGLSSVEDQVGI